MRAKEFILEHVTDLGQKYQDLYSQYYKRAHLKARQKGLTGKDADNFARLALDRYKDKIRTGQWDPITRKSGQGREVYREDISSRVDIQVNTSYNKGMNKSPQSQRIVQWDELGGMNYENKLRVYEALSNSPGYLIESNSPDGVDYLRSLHTTPTVGNNYILSAIALINDQVTSIQDVVWVTLLKDNGTHFVVELPDGRVTTFPDQTISANISMYTYFFSDPKEYNAFRSAIAFKFDTVLPEIDETLEEDWRHFVSGLGAAGILAGGGSAIYDKMQDTNKVSEPQAHVQQVKTPQANVKAPVAKAPEMDAKKAIEHAKDLMALPAAKYLHKAAVAAGLKGSELAQFMGQTAHESANFSTLKEFGDKNYFKKYDIKYNPGKAKELGNVHAGDGERYKGRGYIQLTGRENYRNAGKALGLPLEQKPELVERPDVAAKVALWFWKNRVQPNVSNFQDTQQATKPINPGMKGLADRHNKYTGMKVASAQAPAKVATAPQLAKTAAKAPALAKAPTKAVGTTVAKATTKAPTVKTAKTATKPATKVAATKPMTPKAKKA